MGGRQAAELADVAVAAATHLRTAAVKHCCELGDAQSSRCMYESSSSSKHLPSFG